MSVCVLCPSTDGLRDHVVSHGPPAVDPVPLCGTCDTQLDGDALDTTHWRCLQESAWSVDAPVQVLAVRLLTRLQAAGEGWAADLLDQLWLEDDVRAWAEAGVSDANDSHDATIKVVDCNGTELSDGDAVTLIKDLAVKGGGFTAKRGTMVKNIRLGDDPTHVEGRVQKQAIYLKTIFLKKA
jgi:protein PhnA